MQGKESVHADFITRNCTDMGTYVDITNYSL